MENIFLELINLSISASVAIVLVWVFRLLLKNSPKLLLCILWCIVWFKLIVPFSIEAPVSIMPRQDIIQQKNLVFTVFDESVRLDEDSIQIENDVNNDGSVIAEKTKSIDMTSSLAVVWFIGVVVLVSYSLVDYIKLRYVLKGSDDFDYGIKISKSIKTPFVMGFISPKIYIPDNMDEVQLVHVIAHERCHIRHKDHILKLVAYLILSLHWFNPLVWVSYALFCRDIEVFCDESVIKKLNKAERRAYSNALLRFSTNNYISTASPIAFGELCVKERVEKIMTYRKPSFWIVALSVIAVIVAVACVITGSSGPGKPVNAVYNYQILAYSYTSDDFEYSADKLPKIKVSGDGIVSYRFNDYAEWIELGNLEPVDLSFIDFDSLFPSSGSFRSGTNAALIEGSNTQAFCYTAVADQYTDYLYLVYFAENAYYDVVRVDNETSEVLINWLMMAHPSWDSKVLHGGNYPDAVETAILEKNEGSLNGDFACVSTTFLGDSNRDETEIATYCTYLYRSYDVETQSYEQLFEHVKMDFDIEKDEFGIYQFTLTSYELLDPAKLDDYKTSSGDLAFRNHSLEPSDNMMQNCDDQFAEYLEYLEKYQ